MKKTYRNLSLVKLALGCLSLVFDCVASAAAAYLALQAAGLL